MSPVAELRDAAVLLRQRATAATPGPWRYNPLKQWLTVEDKTLRDAFVQAGVTGEEFVGAGPVNKPVGVATTGPADHPQSMADATFIACMDPLVGPALAALLENIADDMDDDRAEEAPVAEGRARAVRTGFPRHSWRWDWTATLALARLILAGGGS